MKKYWIIIIIGLIIILGSIIYIFYHHPRRFRKLYMSFITRDLTYNSKHIDGSLKYRLYAPNHKSSKLPLIIYLHGSGQRGNDNRKQLDFAFYKLSSYSNQKNHPSFIIAPQCPSGREWVNRSNQTIPFTHYLQDETKESVEMKLILALIKDFCIQYPVDVNRIYVSGFSMGATGTWDILTRYPDVFAGAAIFSGVSDTTTAHLIRHIPIWAFSGENDSIAPAKLNENMCNTVNKYNVNCQFTKFENIGHDCVSTAFENADIIKWLFSQKKKKQVLNNPP